MSYLLRRKLAEAESLLEGTGPALMPADEYAALAKYALALEACCEEMVDSSPMGALPKLRCLVSVVLALGVQFNPDPHAHTHRCGCGNRWDCTYNEQCNKTKDVEESACERCQGV